MMVRGHVSLLLAGFGALAATAEAVAAPSLNPLKLCYVSVRTAPDTYDTETIPIGGTGFTPGAVVDIRIDDDVVATDIPIDANGTLPPGSVQAPTVERGQRVFTVTATERGAGTQTISLQALVSDLSVKVRPKRARPSQQVRFTGRGFTDQGAIYAHYVRKGALRKTVRLSGPSSGACGTFSIKRLQFPFRPRKGTWTVQIDQHRRFGKQGPLVRLAIDVKRTPRTKE